MKLGYYRFRSELLHPLLVSGIFLHTVINIAILSFGS